MCTRPSRWIASACYRHQATGEHHLDTPANGCYTRPTMQRSRSSKPPRVLRRPGVLLDNVALVPASLLPFKKEWQPVANRLPSGSVLLCSMTSARQKKILEQVSAHLKRKRRCVTTLPAQRFAAE
jgi:hypothetical protein